MSKMKMIQYIVILSLMISLAFNYYFYKEKEGYIVQMGAENQRTVRATMHEMNDGNIDFWLEKLKEPNGDVYLERHMGELRQLSQEFHQMNGEMSAVGMVVDEIIKNYYDLAEDIKWEKNIDIHKSAIEEDTKFLKRLLTEINSEFGENKKRWYEGLSGFQTETQKKVWEQFKKEQTRNN